MRIINLQDNLLQSISVAPRYGSDSKKEESFELDVRSQQYLSTYVLEDEEARYIVDAILKAYQEVEALREEKRLNINNEDDEE